jgi:DNA invertase Pin-like site-specific DNA recombinase
MEAGIDFEAVDFPAANRFTLHIMAAVAEHEAKAISERTKAALAAAKARGKKLGGYRGAVMTAKIRAAGRKRLVEQANARAADLAPIVDDIRASGITTLRGIAAALNERAVPTVRGGEWQGAQVMHLLARLTPSAEAKAAT